MEVYGPVEVTVPAYQDPSPHTEQTYDITELEMRLKSLEELLLATIHPKGDEPIKEEVAPTSIIISEAKDRPGFTTIRTLFYKDRQLEVPLFPTGCLPIATAFF